MMGDTKILSSNASAGQSVYLLDDREVMRRRLRQLMEPEGLAIVGESSSARGAVRRVPAHTTGLHFPIGGVAEAFL
jgi:PleD family two-component response regulator